MIRLVALCAIGAEKIVANELKQLGYTNEPQTPPYIGRLVFSHPSLDPLTAIFRANLCLRTSDRVYIELANFSAFDFDSLFEGVYSIPWQDWFKKDIRIVVDKVRTKKSKLSSERTVQSLVHKAIYEKLGSVWRMHTLPESGTKSDIRIYIENNHVQVLLDTSGLPLHRRGYRTSGGDAPIRETLAAILLQAASWKRKIPLHDAFCGSGTIPIEAILYAHNIAPGLGRNFALEHLSPFLGEQAQTRMNEERKKAAEEIRTDCLVRVTGSDLDSSAVAKAISNAERACGIAGKALQLIGSDARIPRPSFTQASFEDLSAPYETGLLLSNPPWGERLSDIEEAKKLYGSMVSLFTEFPRWNFGFISNHEAFEVSIKRTAVKKRALKSGNLDTVFYYY